MVGGCRFPYPPPSDPSSGRRGVKFLSAGGNMKALSWLRTFLAFVFHRSQVERKFSYKVVDAQITFETDSSGRASSLTLHQNGADMPAKRIQ